MIRTFEEFETQSKTLQRKQEELKRQKEELKRQKYKLLLTKLEKRKQEIQNNLNKSNQNSVSK